MSTPDDIVTVAAEDLVTTWRTLHTVARNYQPGSTGETHLIEAARFMEVEMRAQRGDETWAALTSRGPVDEGEPDAGRR